MSTATAAAAAAPQLLKKADVCRTLKVSGPTFEQMLADGLLPAPIWLGPTVHSRRWRASVIARHISRATTRPRPTLELVR